MFPSLNAVFTGEAPVKTCAVWVPQDEQVGSPRANWPSEVSSTRRAVANDVRELMGDYRGNKHCTGAVMKIYGAMSPGSVRKTKASCRTLWWGWQTFVCTQDHRLSS